MGPPLVRLTTPTRHAAVRGFARRICSGGVLGPRARFDAAVSSGALREDAHQQAAIEHLDRLHADLLVWRPPPPPAPPPPPKESVWKGPQMDAYGEPIGGGTFYTGVKNEEGSGLWAKLTGLLSSSDDAGEGAEPSLASGVAAPRGVYLYGGSGCGKSMLVDQYFAPAVVPPPGAASTWVRRVHLHEYLLEMHQRVHRLRVETPEIGDPMPYLAYELICETQVLLLDEVAVYDVADALLLRKLFRRLFHSGMVVVATSNRAPSELYLNGLQRDSFLPFIDDVQQRCDVHELDSTTDYRSIASAASGVARLSPNGLGAYLHPLGAQTSTDVGTLWELLSEGQPSGPLKLQLSGRSLDVSTACEATRAARFTFDELCGAPLGPEDYLRISRAFGTVIVEDVPQLSLSRSTELRRLITMIDALYDEQVMLVISAAVPMEQLYVATGSDAHADKFGDVIGNIVQDSGDEGFAWRRTLSRLQEMSSQAYITRSNSWKHC